MKLSYASYTLIVLSLFTIAPAFAQTTGSVQTGSTNTGTTVPTLLQQLDMQKNTAISTLGNTVQGFMQTSFSGTENIERNTQYQSLVCLGILTDQQLSQTFSGAVAKLKTDILEDYASQKSQIDRINLGLTVDKNKLQIQITNFASIYETLTKQLINSYQDKVQILKTTVDQYAKSNGDLLNSVNGKVIQLNSIMNQFDALDDLVFQFNNLFMLQQGSLLDTLSNQKKDAQKQLDEKLQTYITTQTKRFTNLLGYDTVLQSRENDSVRLYGLDFDEGLQDVVGSRYSRQAHDSLKQQIDTIKKTFYENGTLRCQNILTSNMDIKGYAESVSANITDMTKNLHEGMLALQQTGSAEKMKQAIFTIFKSFYTDRMDAELASLKKFASEQFTAFTDRSTTQGKQLEDIQATKKRYDSSKNETEKNELRGSIIAQGKKLYDEAVLQSIKNILNPLLTALGLDLTPPAEDMQGKVVQTENIFFPIIAKMAKSMSASIDFSAMLQKSITKLDAKAEKESPANRILIEQIKEAIQLYIADSTK